MDGVVDGNAIISSERCAAGNDQVSRSSTLPVIVIDDNCAKCDSGKESWPARTTIEQYSSQNSDKVNSAEKTSHHVVNDLETDGKSPFEKLRLWIDVLLAAIFRKASVLYKTYIYYGLLRQRIIILTKDGRHIDLDLSRRNKLIDEKTGKEYISNRIRSSRYTIWTFLPYQIFFQFTKAANLYFLIVGILQLIPGFSTTGSFTTIVPLLLFLSFSIAREGYDDFRRYRLDKVENGRLARVLDVSAVDEFGGEVGRSWSGHEQTSSEVPRKELDIGSSARRDFTGQISTPTAQATSAQSLWKTAKWSALKVGDIIELRRDDQLPADIVLLHVDGSDGIAYTETMALDGETNLKSKEPSQILVARCQTPSATSCCNAHFVIEDPNRDLYEFTGKVTLDEVTMPLSLKNVIFRGSTLRNTKSAIGMIINTGEECKIRMNASKNPKAKAPALQTETNKAVLSLAALVVLLAVGCTAGYIIWQKVFESKAWYLAGAEIWKLDIFIAFAIQFNNLIPLAMYVSLEIVKLAQFLLLHDIEMYDPVSDIPMVSNTQTIFENLGQINYLLSDKTGTLTENTMRFRMMSVAGTSWHCEDPEEMQHGIAKSDEAIAEDNKSIPKVSVSGKTHRNTTVSPRPQSATSKTVPNSTDARQFSTNQLLRYLQKSPETKFAQKVKFFILSIALCHTCFIDRNAGEIEYEAASPDEVALVEAAKNLGYIVVDRTTRTITIETLPAGATDAVREQYEVLDVIEFSSSRKRMSIIIRLPTGKLCIFCKGADSVILPRLRLATLAAKQASKVAAREEQRVGLEVQNILIRRSEEVESRRSFHSPSLHRPSLHLAVSQRPSLQISPPQESGIRLSDSQRPSFQRASFSLDRLGISGKETNLGRKSVTSPRISNLGLDRDTFVRILAKDSESLDDAEVFEKCFEDINRFATEGLRTLLYAHRTIEEVEYLKWKETYHQAETSLVDRRTMIEATAERIETDFDLTGATAIEDKLQDGVPETIEKLRRAGIKIWMLTGDKRETAINVAHAAGICKPFSTVVLFEPDDYESQMESLLFKIAAGEVAHSVVVIDGSMLDEIEETKSLSRMFSSLMVRVDSIIIYRASPSQKANMVKKIRHSITDAMTLAIGDGGNDIAMIQEAHVGVGISGKEGLQAARVADYSIAQFRFLQRLLLVHGHWNYSRTADYILYTFWKETLFYSVQIMFQRWNGYTGPSFYETTGLTVWNTLFSSLCVMIPAIFEQDLSASTLLLVPELYAYGHQKKGFNMRLYTFWMVIAGVQSQIIWWMIYGLYGILQVKDAGLFAIGNLAFSIVVVYINFKLLVINYRHRTWIPIFSAALTIFGWWAWCLFLSAIFSNSAGPYAVRGGFIHHFGTDLTWWAVFVAMLAALVVLDLAFEACKRLLWPSAIQVWQQIENEGRVSEVVGGMGDGVDDEGVD